MLISSCLSWISVVTYCCSAEFGEVPQFLRLDAPAAQDLPELRCVLLLYLGHLRLTIQQ
jgi:hypothetical protein